MKKLYFIILFLIFSCSENQVSIDISTLSKYNIVTTYNDVADTLNVYLDKTLGLTLEMVYLSMRTNLLKHYESWCLSGII